MKQIGNGYKYYYYLTDDGRVYNAKYDHYLSDYGGCYKLRTEKGESLSISSNSLLMLVYGSITVQDNIDRLDGEEFRSIPGTNDNYAISNYGRCISYIGNKAHLLRQAKNTPNGYYRVNIRINGRQQSKLVHQLVAAAFCQQPEDLPLTQLQIHHIDFNKENNAASNLEYLSPEQHMKKHIERGPNNVSSELEEDLYREIQR